MLSEEMIMTMLKKVSDEKAERTPVIITYPSVDSLYLALTPSQLALLDILRNYGAFEEEVGITLLADVEWEMP